MVAIDFNHRRRNRALVHQKIVVIDVLKQLEVGRLVNIHEEGLMVIGAGEVKENHIYQLELRLTERVEGKYKISIGAECLWTKEADSADQYWAGFYIVDISEEDLLLIRKLFSTN